MLKKPIIVIMTSKDEFSCAGERLAEAIRRYKTHNVVVLSDDKYGSAAKLSALERLMDTGQEYMYLLEKRDGSVIREKFGVKRHSRRVNRIVNMTKRFHPQFIVTVTPYAYHAALEAKRRAKLKVDIICVLSSFVAPKKGFDDQTSLFIVENADIKSDLVRNGVRSKNVFVLGLPYEAKRLSEEEISFIKQERGLKGKLVYVDVKNYEAKCDLVKQMSEQGGIATFVLDLKGSKDRQPFEAMAEKVEGCSLEFVPAEEDADLYLSISDAAIVDYDPSVIYKCFKLGVPAMIFSRDEHAENDINYLVSEGLAIKASDELEAVKLLYALLDTPLAEELRDKGLKRTCENSLEAIASYLVSYIPV